MTYYVSFMLMLSGLFNDLSHIINNHCCKIIEEKLNDL